MQVLANKIFIHSYQTVM